MNAHLNQRCAAFIGAALAFSQVSLAVQTPPETPAASPREASAIPSEPLPYMPFIAAVISGNAAALEDLLQNLSKEHAKLIFERVFHANIAGFEIHGSAIFFMMRLLRYDLLKIYLRYIEQHPELAEAAFRRDIIGAGPLHWLLENRAFTNLIIRAQIDDQQIPFMMLGVPLIVTRPSEEESAKRERIVALILDYLSRHPENNYLFTRRNEQGHTALHAAVHSGWIEVVRQLLATDLAPALLVNMREAQFAQLDNELARDIWTEVLIAQPILFRLHDQNIQLATVTAGVRAIVGRNLEGVRNLLAAGDLRIDARLLHAMWERVDRDTNFETFMDQLWALDWRGHERQLDEIIFAWNRRLRPHLFNGHVLNMGAVLATVLAAQLGISRHR